MRARIYTTVAGVVVVEEDNPRAEWDENAPARITTRYFVPDSGGYVRMQVDGDEDRWPRQVCDGLYSTGPTLWCSNPENLPDIIRRERRRGIAAERRAMRG